MFQSVQKTACIALLFLNIANSSIAKETEGKVHWQFSCLSPNVCELRSEIKQGDSIAANLSILHARGTLWLQYLLPVSLSIDHGVTVDVDGKEIRQTVLSNCTALGCSGYLNLDPGFLEALKQGKIAHVNFLNTSQHQSFTISFDLTSFALKFIEFYHWP